MYLNVFESDQNFENVFLKNKKNNNTTVITTSADSNELECLHTQKQRQKRIQEYCAQNRVSKKIHLIIEFKSYHVYISS